MKVKESDKVDSHKLTPLYARYLVRLIRPFPNFDFFFVKSLRQKAVQLLQLKRGDRVLDVGCGPGGNFPYLVDAVSPSGEVVGVEISPEIAINARRRIEKNRWSNVHVIEANAETVKLNGQFDGLLLFAAPDAYASAQALANLFPYLRDDARVLAFGAKLSHYRLGKMFNLFLRSTCSNLSFPSTPDLNYDPWVLLESRVGELHVREYFFGCMFLAWGSINAGRKSNTVWIKYQAWIYLQKAERGLSPGPYTYAANNPGRFVDASGKDWVLPTKHEPNKTNYFGRVYYR